MATEISTIILELAGAIKGIASSLFSAKEKEKTQEQHERDIQTYTSDTSDTFLDDVFQDIVESPLEIFESFEDKMIQDTKNVYEDVHATPFEKTMDYAKSGAKHGIKYDKNVLTNLYKLHKGIGIKKAKMDEQLTRDVGITGTPGSIYKKMVRGVTDFITGENKSVSTGIGTIVEKLNEQVNEVENKSNRARVYNKNTNKILDNQQRQGD